MPRTYKSTSVTWRLFEASFVLARGKAPNGDWLQLPCDSKGQAINLAQGMNACNMQYHKEQGMPLSMSDISARPMEYPQGSGQWLVQLGESYTHRGKRNQRLESMLEQTLGQSGFGATDAPKTANQVIAPKAISEEQRIQHQEEEDAKIRKLMGL